MGPGVSPPLWPSADSPTEPVYLTLVWAPGAVALGADFPTFIASVGWSSSTGRTRPGTVGRSIALVGRSAPSRIPVALGRRLRRRDLAGLGGVSHPPPLGGARAGRGTPRGSGRTTRSPDPRVLANSGARATPDPRRRGGPGPSPGGVPRSG